MARKIKYYLVAADALPEIFIRVAEAKCMMQTGRGGYGGSSHQNGWHQPQRFLQV